MSSAMGDRRVGGQNGYFPALEIGTKNQNFLENLKPIPITWFHFCYDSLFDGMALTLHKNQVHCPGVMQLQ